RMCPRSYASRRDLVPRRRLESVMYPTLLVEIGCEELPTSFLDGAMEQLGVLVPEELGRARVQHGAVRVMGTPRRLAVLVREVAPTVPSHEEEILGPPESSARGADGAWS